ncbi:DUF3034 family protein [Marinicella sp. W31]|uniref:DUF3034 family protein n=1 Tax=Marinicella sp. W31 TaxID=3023713 RepID=UPI003757D868
MFRNICIAMAACVVAAHAVADSRQLGTGAAMQIEGASGSGIVPWATIAGYGEIGEFDLNAGYTFVDTDDYELDVMGVSVGWSNRVELSFARQELDLITLGPAIGLPGATLEQDVFGAKVRLAGNLVYTRMPQISLGVQYKKTKNFLIPQTVGALDDSDFDYYLSATKLFLGQPAGLNGFATMTLRSTRANETGLLGFGGDNSNDRHYEMESAIGLFLTRKVALGFDFRRKSSNLTFATEDHWRDLFVAWVPNRHVSVVAAYVDLGDIATLEDQTGYYLSINGSF